MTKLKVTAWADATRAVENAKTVVVIGHISPDGDAIGTMLGLTNALRMMGKQVDTVVEGGCSDYLMFLPGADTIQSGLKTGDWDLFISVDTSDEERTGEPGNYARLHSKSVINLDHHATNTLFGNVQLVDESAVSATEMAYTWLRFMDFDLTFNVAQPLLCGLVTDTLGFRTSNVTAHTLYIAQQLMAAGAVLTEITQRTLDTRSILAVNLWKNALPSVEMHAGGVIALEITQEDLKTAGLRDVTDGGLVGFLVRTNEAMISVVFKETEEGEINVSMRSKPGYDVAAVAFSLGGGGHVQAAGATIPGPMADAKKRVLGLLKEAARNGKPHIV